ncbi:hypothetical protein BH18ACT5_BH18ACT5_02810 [soil metagenome]
MSSAAENLVRSWVRLYTLDLGDRDGRRAEIESDLWEHQHDAQASGEGAVAISILGRWAAGLPADLSWRVSRRRSRRTNKESLMPTALSRSWWQVLAALTAGASVYAGVDQFFADDVAVGVDVGKVLALLLFVGAGVLIGIGLTFHRTEPGRGARLVMIGVLPMALIGGLGISESSSVSWRLWPEAWPGGGFRSGLSACWQRPPRWAPLGLGGTQLRSGAHPPARQQVFPLLSCLWA